MYNDIDESIKQLLITKIPLDPAEVNISFEAPNREWAAAQSKPSINLYMYDIRENHELRSFDWSVEYKENVSTKKKAPTRMDLSYFITVWSRHIPDEHRLLGLMTAVLMQYPILPKEVLQGNLSTIDYPVYASAAQPDSVLKSPSDFWSTMDNQLKPSINYLVTLPVDLSISIEAPVVFTKFLDVMDREGGETEEMVQIGGTVHSTGKKDAVIPNTMLQVKELNISTTSDMNGQYKLPKMRRGEYTFKVSAPKKATKEITVVVPGDNYNIEI